MSSSELGELISTTSASTVGGSGSSSSIVGAGAVGGSGSGGKSTSGVVGPRARSLKGSRTSLGRFDVGPPDYHR